MPSPLFVHLPLTAVTLLGLLWMRSPRRVLGAAVLQPVVTFLTTIPGVYLWTWTFYGALSAVAWWLFVHLPILALGMAVAGQERWLRALSGAVAFALVAVGVDAFLIEPRWLEVTTHQISAPGLERPLRVALLADIQTDRVGAWEAEVLARAEAAQPDLWLFAGDYVQVRESDPQRPIQRARFRELLRSLDLDAPLGLFAVQGDNDGDGWEEMFEGTRIHVTTSTQTRDLGPLMLTMLSVKDSRYGAELPEVDGFHVVLAHRPGFSAFSPAADLLLTGHVHGGQVRLPLWGPLLTFTDIPRSWAVGRTTLPHGAELVVSRGIGMEQDHAPRLRFLCRPELVILDLIPSHELPALDRKRLGDER